MSPTGRRPAKTHSQGAHLRPPPSRWTDTAGQAPAAEQRPRGPVLLATRTFTSWKLRPVGDEQMSLLGGGAHSLVGCLSLPRAAGRGSLLRRPLGSSWCPREPWGRAGELGPALGQVPQRVQSGSIGGPGDPAGPGLGWGEQPGEAPKGPCPRAVASARRAGPELHTLQARGWPGRCHPACQGAPDLPALLPQLPRLQLGPGGFWRFLESQAMEVLQVLLGREPGP